MIVLHALQYRTPRVRHGGPEGYGASDPRGAICRANVNWYKKSLREEAYESPQIFKI